MARASAKSYAGVNIGWFIPLRLISFILVSAAVIGWLGFPSYLRWPFYSYAVVTLATLLSLLFLSRFDYRILFRLFIFLHFIAEIINEAGIVYSSGNLYSPFSALFLLTIVSSALAYRLVGTLLIATTVSLIFAGVNWLHTGLTRGNLIPPILSDGPFTADDTFFYAIFLHILIFYLVAFISGYLAEKLQSKNKELDTASAELKRARLDTGDILWHLNCGLVTVDRGGEIIFFNRTAEAILELRGRDVAGRHYTEVFTGQLAPLAEDLEATMRAQRRSFRTEFEIIRADGGRIPVGLSSSTLFDEEFNIRGVMSIFQDLTEAKLLEERMRQADRMAAIGELSACIAHEIRNPLASISGSVELLKKDMYPGGDDERLFSLIIKETARLNRILSDFLLYARAAAPEFRKVELISVVSEVTDLIRQHPSYHRQISLYPGTQEAVMYVSGDEDQIKQLLLNLLVNACEAIGGGPGEIDIECFLRRSQSGPQVGVSIRDNGPGIKDELRQKIFEPFFSTKKGGTGLGLSIVSKLVEAMGGEVEVRSLPSRGTEFSIYFRAYADRQERQPAPVNETAARLM